MRLAVLWLSLIAITFGIYWTGLNGEFMFDDIPNIVINPNIHITSLTPTNILSSLAGLAAGPLGRPVSVISFALSYYFFGLNAFAFKFTNLSIHVATAFLVFTLSRRILSCAISARHGHVSIAAIVAAAIWLLHPIQLLPVLHVVQRMTILSAFFLLAALLLHIKGREGYGGKSIVWISVSWCILWPLSFLSKENGALFPLFVLAWEMILCKKKNQTPDKFTLILASVTCLTLFSLALYTLLPTGKWIWATYDSRSFSLSERILTETRVMWRYLGLIFYPRLDELGLHHDDIPISSEILSPPSTLLSILGLTVLSWITWKNRKRHPLIAFGILWFFIGHAMESTVLPLEISHEHRNYVPLFGVILIASFLFLQLLRLEKYGKTVPLVLISATLGYLAFITTLRADQFGNEILRTQIEAQHHRNSARTQYEAGAVLSRYKDTSDKESQAYMITRAHYERASELDPNFKQALLGLINLNCIAGIRPTQTDIGELSRRLHTTPFSPGDRNVLYSLKEMSISGALCLSRKEIDLLFHAALTNRTVLTSTQAILHSWHADYLWINQHDIAAARAELYKSLSLVPNNPSNRLKLAQIMLLSGEQQKAKEILSTLHHTDLSPEEQKTFASMLVIFADKKS